VNNKKYTLVLGASEKRERYSNKAIRMLLQNGHPIVAIGNKKGHVETIPIETEKIFWDNIDTITLYLGILHQKEYYDYILNLKPKRIIFNPGTENDELQNLAEQNGIECLEACTLVLLSIGNY
jgi:predicted CoA-binding protein